MLVLTRKRGESIQIGDNITVKVVAIEGGKVRLGIEAPDHVRIMRGELLARALTEASSADVLPFPPARGSGLDAA